MEETKVIIVDGREIFRVGLAKVLADCAGLEVVWSYPVGNDAIEKAKEIQTAVVVMDVELDYSEKLDAIRQIRKVAPNTGILVLTHLEKPTGVLPVLAAGANGYVSKDLSIDELVRAIAIIAHGGAVVSPPMASSVLSELNRLGQKDEIVKQISGLTSREKEVLSFVVNGASNKDIAEQLVISENTVKVHLHHILEKLRVHSRAQVIALVHTQAEGPGGNGDRA